MKIFYIICNVDCRIFCTFILILKYYSVSLPGLSLLGKVQATKPNTQYDFLLVLAVCCHLGQYRNFD